MKFFSHQHVTLRSDSVRFDRSSVIVVVAIVVIFIANAPFYVLCACAPKIVHMNKLISMHNARNHVWFNLLRRFYCSSVLVDERWTFHCLAKSFLFRCCCCYHRGIELHQKLHTVLKTILKNRISLRLAQGKGSWKARGGERERKVKRDRKCYKVEFLGHMKSWLASRRRRRQRQRREKTCFSFLFVF